MILIHFKRFFARALALIRPKEGSELNFSIICLAMPRLVKNFGEKQKLFFIDKNVYVQK